MTRRYLLGGRVQGVGFRWFTAKRAGELGIDGWVRNLADGGVEILARGSPDALEAFDEYIRTGPRGSVVTNVEMLQISDEVDLASGFAVID